MIKLCYNIYAWAIRADTSERNDIMQKVDKYRYKFMENDIEIVAEKHTLITLAKSLREAEVEGTWSDLAYQIEYAFDIDGVRSEDEDYILEECKRQWHENQEENYGPWEAQTEEERMNYYNQIKEDN